MNNTTTKMKNTLEGINSKKTEALTPREKKKVKQERKQSRYNSWFK